MAQIDVRKKLVGRLNKVCRAALEEASNICVAAGHSQVSLEHFLLALCEQDGNDFRVILRKFELDVDLVRDAVRSCLARFRSAEGVMPVLSPVLFDILEAAWLISSLEAEEKYIRSGAVLLALLRDSGRYCRYEYAVLLDKIPAEKLTEDFFRFVNSSVEQQYEVGKEEATTAAVPTEDKVSALEKYAENFTRQAKNGKIDPVFCRDCEIRQIIDILARRRKNNPICVGDAGVGKTAVIEGLAYKIVHDDVPESLLGAEIYGLDMGALEAGASVKGEFEKRLKAVLDEIKNADRQIILFIDEAHTLIGAGGNAGGNDAANLLKPALARGEIKTIAATTWSEYKKYFEKDPALARRFQLVKLDEPAIDQAEVILRGLAPAYEKAHKGVYITDAGIKAAAVLSARYITGRQLPDKAIDVLDTACARVQASGGCLPLVLEKLIQKGKALEREKASLERDAENGFDAAVIAERLNHIHEKLASNADETTRLREIYAEQKELAETLKDLKNADGDKDEILRSEARAKFETLRKERPLVSLEVGSAEIASVIADWTGIPISNMSRNEISDILRLKDTVGAVLKGQGYALQVIAEQLQVSRLDLHKAGRPRGVFLLTGPSGTGKTETAYEIARKLFGGDEFVTSVNMTEFQEKHTVSRLIGSPPGYVGYGEGGLLTEAIRKKPYSVVLLDEAEKADSDVLNLFYQAFDKGVLSDGEGREIDCKNVIFFLTSNLAAEQIQDLAQKQEKPSAETILHKIKPILMQHFGPALLARMQPIIYLPLSHEVMRKIIAAKLGELKSMFLARQNIELSISDEAVGRLEALCTEASGGARLIDGMVQKCILPEISRAVLEELMEEKKICYVSVDIDEAKKFVFQFGFEDGIGSAELS